MNCQHPIYLAAILFLTLTMQVGCTSQVSAQTPLQPTAPAAPRDLSRPGEIDSSNSTAQTISTGENLKARRNQLKIQLQDLGQYFGPNHPTVVELKKQLEVLDELMNSTNPNFINDTGQTQESDSLKKLKDEYVRYQMEYSRLSQHFGPKHPQVISISDRLALVVDLIRDHQAESSQATDHAPERIISLAKNLNEEITKLQPLQIDEQQLNRAKSELQSAIEFLKTHESLVASEKKGQTTENAAINLKEQPAGSNSNVEQTNQISYKNFSARMDRVEKQLNDIQTMLKKRR